MYNSNPHSVTGVVPWTLLFGWQPKTPVDHLVGNIPSDLDEDYVRQQAEFMERAHSIVRDRLTRAAEFNERYCDGQSKLVAPLEIGSRVLINHCAFDEAQVERQVR